MHDIKEALFLSFDWLSGFRLYWRLVCFYLVNTCFDIILLKCSSILYFWNAISVSIMYFIYRTMTDWIRYPYGYCHKYYLSDLSNKCSFHDFQEFTWHYVRKMVITFLTSTIQLTDFTMKFFVLLIDHVILHWKRRGFIGHSILLQVTGIYFFKIF